jgi:hypothetical protein
MRISQSLDTPLGRWHRLALRVHLYLCSMCRRFEQQARLLQQVGQLIGQTDRAGLGTAAILSPRARERIKQALWRQGPETPV